MQRIAVFIYGIVSYAFFFTTFLYAVGFVGGFAVPHSIDSPPSASLGVVLVVDVLLLAIFALAARSREHSPSESHPA